MVPKNFEFSNKKPNFNSSFKLLKKKTHKKTKFQ